MPNARKRGKATIGLLTGALLLAPACGGSKGERAGRGTQPPREGHVTCDDGVRLYYETAGEGGDVVVIPFGFYLRPFLERLAEGRRLVFYHPRNRGRSDAAPLSSVSLDRQILDLEQLRATLGIEKMALVGWSGMGMELAVYAMRHPDRVTRLLQVSPVPPRARIMQEEGGDRRAERVDREAVGALEARFDRGEFDDRPADFCREYNRLTLPGNFVDATLAGRVPDVCDHENEWPKSLWPYFGTLLRSFGEYDWSADLASLDVPRLVIHGREDGIPVAGARAWVKGQRNARLIVLSPAGHFPFLEQPEAFFAAAERFLAGGWPEQAEVVQ